MKCNKSQQGMTAIGWLLVLAILSIFLIIGIKLVPVYIGGYSLYSSMDAMETNPKLQGMPARQLRKKVMTIIDLNYVAAYVRSEDVTIIRRGKGYEVNIAYSVYRPILGNLSLVVDWEKTVTIP